MNINPRFINRMRIVLSALWQSVLPRRRPAPAKIKRILIAHNMLLGDTILLAALMKKIRREYPQAECFVLCRPGFISLLACQPYGFQALPFDLRDSSSIDHIFRHGPYDLALVPDDNRYAWLARAAGAKWTIGFADDTPRWKNWMLDQAIPFPDSPQTWSDLMAELIDGASPEPFQSHEWKLPAATLPGDLPARYAVLHLGAGSPLRYWPTQYWSELAQQLTQMGLVIVLTASAQESEQLNRVDPAQQYRHFPGNLTLDQMGQMLAHASLLVCADTGITHLARLAGVATVVLYGPGTPILHGNGQFWGGHKEKNIWQPNFPCRNQAELFRRTVPWVVRCKRSYGDEEDQCSVPACMKGVSVQQVVAEVKALLVTEPLGVVRKDI